MAVAISPGGDSSPGGEGMMDLAAGRMSSGANKRIFDLNTTVGSIGGDMASSGGAGGGMDVDEVDG